MDNVRSYFAFHVAGLGSRPEPRFKIFCQSMKNASNTGFSIGGNVLAALWTLLNLENSCCMSAEVKTSIFPKNVDALLGRRTRDPRLTYIVTQKVRHANHYTTVILTKEQWKCCQVMKIYECSQKFNKEPLTEMDAAPSDSSIYQIRNCHQNLGEYIQLYIFWKYPMWITRISLKESIFGSRMSLEISLRNSHHL